jgi:lipoprotein signal peptidase
MMNRKPRHQKSKKSQDCPKGSVACVNMQTKLKRNIIFRFVFIVVFVVLDLLLKSYFIDIGQGFFNTGVSWGFGSNIPSLWLIRISLFLNLLLFLISLRLVFYKRIAWGLTLIVAGGLANMFSRIIWGAVWDWISLGNLSTFNLADIVISIGFAIFIMQIVVDNFLVVD